MLQYIEQFVKLVQAVAWPGVVVWFVYLFRKQMSELIDRLQLKKMSFDKGKLEAEFAEKLEAAKEQAALETPVERGLPQGTTTPEEATTRAIETIARSEDRERVDQLASLSPRAAIDEAWVVLSRAIIKAVTPYDKGTVAPALTMVRYIADAHRLGIMTPNMVSSANYLRQLRNEATHNPDFDLKATAAKEYGAVAITLADDIARRAETLSNKS